MGNFFEDLFFGKSEDPGVQQVKTLSDEQEGVLDELLNLFGGRSASWRPTGFKTVVKKEPAGAPWSNRKTYRANKIPSQWEQIPGRPSLINAPGPQPPFDLSPGPGPLSQQMFGQAQGLMGPSTQAVQRMSDPAQNMQFAQGLFEPIQANIANRFASTGSGSARSSGFGQALGRGFAQGVMPQVLGQQAQGAALGLGAAGTQAARQEALRRADIQADLEKWRMGLPGADPRMAYLPLALGTPTFGNIGLPGYQSASPLGGIGMGMMGLGAMGWQPFKKGLFSGLFGG